VRSPVIEPQPAPAARHRLAFAVALGIAVAVYVTAHGLTNPHFTSDFDQVWGGARSLWEGKNPYVSVGPGREYGWNWPLYYPLPALVAVAPLGLLPVLAARVVFASCSAALLAWAITREGWGRLYVFLSVSFLVTIELGQWSNLFAAAFYLPAVGAFAAAKPNISSALVVAGNRPRAITWITAGTVLLLIVSQIIQPGWHEAWLANVRSAEHFRAPVQRPLGFLMILAALRWRRPEARWLLALSLIPQAPSFYDQMLLAVVCLTRLEALTFSVTTCALFFYVGFNTPQPDYAAWGRVVGNGTLWICYFPALVMVLRRPNDGALPLWLLRLGQRKPGAQQLKTSQTT
jgi:hypothetical protein